VSAQGQLTFTVQVTHTDRTRTPAGRFNEFTTNVEVLADTDTDAACIAAQMVGCLRGNGMVLGTRITNCIA